MVEQALKDAARHAAEARDLIRKARDSMPPGAPGKGALRLAGMDADYLCAALERCVKET